MKLGIRRGRAALTATIALPIIAWTAPSCGGRTNGVGGGREAGAAPCELEGSICGSASGAPSGGTSSGASAGEASGESSTPGPDASPTSPPVTDASEPLDSTPNEAGPEDVSIDVPKVIAVPGEAGPDKVVYSATQAKNVASPLPGSGKGITYDGQGLWISQDTSLVRFNQGTTDRTLTLGLTPPANAVSDGITYDGQAIWYSIAGGLARIDVGTGQVTKQMSAPGQGDLDFDGTDIWVANDGDGKVYRIDPGTGGIQKQFGTSTALSGRLNGIAFRGGELWISGLFGVLEVYDADTGALKGTVVHDDGTLYQQSETGPSCFVGNQLVMLSPLGITYYDVVAVP